MPSLDVAEEEGVWVCARAGAAKSPAQSATRTGILERAIIGASSINYECVASELTESPVSLSLA